MCSCRIVSKVIVRGTQQALLPCGSKFNSDCVFSKKQYAPLLFVDLQNAISSVLAAYVKGPGLIRNSTIFLSSFLSFQRSTEGNGTYVLYLDQTRSLSFLGLSETPV